MKTGAFYYPWYDTNRHWNEGSIQTPLLDKYSSRDPKIINQHISWAKKGKIDFFIASWWGQKSFEDIVIKDNLDSACTGNPFKYCLVYESGGLLHTRGDRIDINDPKNLDRLANDFKYFCKNLFPSSNYYKINNKPVVFLYLSRIFRGDVSNALHFIKSESEKLGFNPYLIGDEVYWFDPENDGNQNHKNYDALSLYNPHVSSPDIIAQYWELLPKLYKNWQDYCNSKKINFIPTLIPGFDDTSVRPESLHPIIKRNKEMFIKMLNSYQKDTNLDHLFICSWNEWHENTQIEPSVEENILDL